MTIARNKLVDHWRRAEREQRILRSIHSTEQAEPHWDAPLSLAKIDPATNTVISRYGISAAGGVVAVEQNTVWLYFSSGLYRLRSS